MVEKEWKDKMTENTSTLKDLIQPKFRIRKTIEQSFSLIQSNRAMIKQMCTAGFMDSTTATYVDALVRAALYVGSSRGFYNACNSSYNGEPIFLWNGNVESLEK